MTPGIHLIHKPVGPTSFSLVQQFLGSAAPRPGKRPFRLCHGGTLDPFASGLLLILVEPATRLFDYLHAVPKVYEATIRWGIETDNGDPFGKVVFNGDASGLTAQKLEDVLKRFVGWQEQIPPATSNKRVGGERAYLKAHRGELVELPPSKVYLHEAHWLSHDLPGTSRLEITVRGGYYVRALARDLGRAMECGAHLEQLHRSAIGPWEDPGPDGAIAIHGRELLPWLASRMLSDQEVGDLRKEQTIATGMVQGPEWEMPGEFVGPEGTGQGISSREAALFIRARWGAIENTDGADRWIVIYPFVGWITSASSTNSPLSSS